MVLSKRAEGGFTLLEVLISIVVLSIGLLGAVGMLMAAHRSTGESGAFTAAVNLVRELSEKARINKNIAARNRVDNAYVTHWRSGDPLPDGGSTSGCIGPGAACNQAELAAWDMREWLERVDATLPDARIAVCFDDHPPGPDGGFDWPCNQLGRTLVVKLGWTPRLPVGPENDPARRAPRLVMQLVPGHDYDAFTPEGF